MSDRSDTIVYLANKILNGDIDDVADDHAPSPSHFQMSFKALCFSTCLAALGASGVTAWATEQARPISIYERTELDALVFYAARLSGDDAANVRNAVAQKLGIINFDDLSMKEFTKARDLLRARAQQRRS